MHRALLPFPEFTALISLVICCLSFFRRPPHKDAQCPRCNSRTATTLPPLTALLSPLREPTYADAYASSTDSDRRRLYLYDKPLVSRLVCWTPLNANSARCRATIPSVKATLFGSLSALLGSASLDFLKLKPLLCSFLSLATLLHLFSLRLSAR